MPVPHVLAERHTTSGTAAPRHASVRADRLLLAIGIFFFLLFVASDAVLTHSRAFWRFCKRGGFTGTTASLVVEATLHTTAPGSRDWIVVGSSVVQRDVDVPRLAAAAGRTTESVMKLPLLGGSGLEIAMLTRKLIALHPRAVVLLATPWSQKNDVDWDVLRFYDPLIAADIFSWREVLAEHAAHASGLLAASHVVVRQRASLRIDLFSRILARTAPSGVHAPGIREAVKRARQERFAARREDFGCDNVNVRALAAMAGRVSAAGIALVVVSTPVTGRWGHDAGFIRTVDDCFASLAHDVGFVFLPRSTWSEFPPQMFGDPVHMTDSGRDAFSDELGHALALRLPIEPRGR